MNAGDGRSPESDTTLSPFTGWTRRHWLDRLERMLRGVLACFDGQDPWPHLPASRDGDGLARQLKNPGGASEKLNRTMMLAAVYMAATGRTTIDGFDGDIAGIYRRGLIDSLSVPFHVRTPGSPYNRCDPAAHIALLIAWEHLYEPLPAEEKARLADYLRAYLGHFPNESNLLLFSMTPAVLLERMGESCDRDVPDRLFQFILNMYRGDGWFIDGWNQQFDGYNFWGFQLYLHLFMCFDRRWRERYGARVREITALHERTVPFWFGRDGAPVAKGRSLNYRFAAVSGIQWAQKSGLSSLSGGAARRLCSGCLKYFLDTHGCLTREGILPIGYWGENTAVGEDYTDTGAPYWAATGLMALTLPEQHPFWTEPEQASPADDPHRSVRIAVPGAQMALKTGGARGESRMYVVGEPFRHHRIWQAGSKYFQHAYSSSLGFALAGDLGDELSAGRTGISPDGRQWAYRSRPRMIRVDPRRGRGEWDAGCARDGFEGRVVTESFFLEEGELHVFAHFSPRPQHLRIGGWAVRLESPAEEPVVKRARNHSFLVAGAGSRSLLWSVPMASPVPGDIECVRLDPRPGFAHSHLFGGSACWPQWTSRAPVEPGRAVAVFVDAVRGGPARPPWKLDVGALQRLAAGVHFD